MTEVQRFYGDGMEAAGYGRKTFRLDRDSQGGLRADLVHGRHPMRTYGRNAGGAVRDEVKTSLAKKGIDVDRQTLVNRRREVPFSRSVSRECDFRLMV
jgi:hypothetical protein